MARDNYRKIKLLKLLELLRLDTDEQHPMTTNAISEKLAGMDIPCDRRTSANRAIFFTSFCYVYDTPRTI